MKISIRPMSQAVKPSLSFTGNSTMAGKKKSADH
eukprot:CAMPEP_0115246642 /NCGR_PEP_ID=MMETSP0270-20121206/41133_1 /TAXON_ID=71861 /ORGANISM="Scrippsiella trochoidea, Strain CCMP3099" /LENGTH=33 /DNA_ID= /DNA_START= /DNA_END= /DNA_ORIENTATION=